MAQLTHWESELNTAGDWVSQLQVFVVGFHLYPLLQEQAPSTMSVPVLASVEQSTQADAAPIKPSAKSHSHLAVLMFQ